MSILEPSRRGLLKFILGAACAPLIVKAANIMPVRQVFTESGRYMLDDAPFQFSGFYSNIPVLALNVNYCIYYATEISEFPTAMWNISSLPVDVVAA